MQLVWIVVEQCGQSLDVARSRGFDNLAVKG
jgi:hypothetical protein